MVFSISNRLGGWLYWALNSFLCQEGKILVFESIVGPVARMESSLYLQGSYMGLTDTSWLRESYVGLTEFNIFQIPFVSRILKKKIMWISSRKINKTYIFLNRWAKLVSCLLICPIVHQFQIDVVLHNFSIVTSLLNSYCCSHSVFNIVKH